MVGILGLQRAHQEFELGEAHVEAGDTGPARETKQDTDHTETARIKTG